MWQKSWLLGNITAGFRSECKRQNWKCMWAVCSYRPVCFSWDSSVTETATFEYEFEKCSVIVEIAASDSNWGVCANASVSSGAHCCTLRLAPSRCTIPRMQLIFLLLLKRKLLSRRAISVFVSSCICRPFEGTSDYRSANKNNKSNVPHEVTVVKDLDWNVISERWTIYRGCRRFKIRNRRKCASKLLLYFFIKLRFCCRVGLGTDAVGVGFHRPEASIDLLRLRSKTAIMLQ